MLKRIFNFYISIFKNMNKTVKVVLTIVLVKLIIFFAILKPFFFKKDLDKYKTEKQKSEYVIKQIINKKTN